MSKNINKHFVVDPAGVKHTRGSERKLYSHAVVANRCPDWVRASIHSDSAAMNHRSNYDYYSGIVAGTRRGYSTTPAEAKALLGDATTKDEYVAARIADAVRLLDQQIADGYFDEWVVVGWCSRLDLAQKLCRSHPWLRNLMILPTSRE